MLLYYKMSTGDEQVYTVTECRFSDDGLVAENAKGARYTAPSKKVVTPGRPWVLAARLVQEDGDLGVMSRSWQ